MVATLIVSGWACWILSLIAIALKPNFLTEFVFLCFTLCVAIVTALIF